MNHYLKSTKKFYYSFFLILPLLIIYEIGLWQNVMGTKINGADAILRYFFNFIFSFAGIHISRWLIGIAIVVAIFIFFYYLKKNRIKIKISYLLLMFLESAFVAFILVIIINIILNQNLPDFFSFNPNVGVKSQLMIEGIVSPWSKIVASIGAGIFEEFLFRVVLLRIIYAILARGRNYYFGADSSALIKSIIISSAIFTLMHFGPHHSLFGYISIFIAAIFLSLIYVKRGFGVAATVHAFYDIYLMFGIIS